MTQHARRPTPLYPPPNPLPTFYLPTYPLPPSSSALLSAMLDGVTRNLLPYPPSTPYPYPQPTYPLPPAPNPAVLRYLPCKTVGTRTLPPTPYSSISPHTTLSQYPLTPLP